MLVACQGNEMINENQDWYGYENDSMVFGAYCQQQYQYVWSLCELMGFKLPMSRDCAYLGISVILHCIALPIPVLACFPNKLKYTVSSFVGL